MLDQIRSSLLIATANTRFKIAVQVLILALTLIAAITQSDTALAGSIWGSTGG